jgi:hypothetical protein
MKGVSVVVTYFHKSPSVGENGESLPKRPSWLKNDVSSAFLKKEYYDKKKKRNHHEPRVPDHS